MATLFERIGGEGAVDAAVDIFYKKVLDDPRINHFFAGVDMNRQANHQKKFLTYAFGGTDKYTGRSLREAHKRLVAEMGLNDTHFDAVAENLVATLQELDVPEDLIQEVGGILESTRSEVLNS